MALIGRVNVGKSRLFNRLLRQRRALVEDRPGVTRDRVVARSRIEGREVLLVDTGGLDPDAEEGISGAIQRQVRRVLEDAAVILFVVDVRAGLLPLDRQIGDLLRRATSQVLVVANKADGVQLDDAAAEFHALGFPEVVPVSAEHKRGLVDLELLIEQRLPPPDADAARDEAGNGRVRVALVGRPNVGKSSLLNRLLGEDQAIVSELPGTTRDATDSRLMLGNREVILDDTAGLRRAGRRTAHLERGSAYMALRAIERADVALLLLDASEGVTDQDAKIARLALDCGRPLVLLCNKWDLVDSEARGGAFERQIKRKLGFVRDPVVLRVSALTGQGSGRILPAAVEFFESVRREATTADVNRALNEAVQRNPPPRLGRRPARFYYATQTSSRPFTLLIFMNDPRLLPRNYRKYLEGFFRNYFGLRSAPLRLRLRSRARAPEEGGEQSQTATLARADARTKETSDS